jgi:hypothetical protein
MCKRLMLMGIFCASINLVAADTNEAYRESQLQAFANAFPNHNPNRWIWATVKNKDGEDTVVTIHFSSLLLDKSGNNLVGLRYQAIPLQQVIFPLETVLKTEPQSMENTTKGGAPATAEVITIKDAILRDYDSEAEHSDAQMTNPAFNCITNESKSMFVVHNGSTPNDPGVVRNHKFFIGNTDEYLPLEIALLSAKTPYFYPVKDNGSIEIRYQMPHQRIGNVARIYIDGYEVFEQNYHHWEDKKNFSEEHRNFVAKKQRAKKKALTDDSCVIW